ncbi:HlyU family transcriptional regulator [Rhizobium sp. TRM96647]|uniref:HlyU family transcriptional regulator n=1 Tax=unclassified Rhizobium TaxID=2613769 RepID=UPI0021E835F7|nr:MULTISPECIES: HlyU family transcriptional regulator [unclassified Rhizobium]MCV3737822.1 HlyU family transcriptional regulator [Rhizobium sp. TRM96647]MCV3759448.1 HlyU family transcriptional regulator [Rhizobium sp. TRM96650]
MASFFSKLFGLSGKSEAQAPTPEDRETYNELVLVATPMPEGSQFRLAGRIEKHGGEVVLVRSFVRADVFTSRDDTVAAAFRKARQIVDQHGPSLFSDGEPSRNV